MWRSQARATRAVSRSTARILAALAAATGVVAAGGSGLDGDGALSQKQQATKQTTGAIAPANQQAAGKAEIGPTEKSVVVKTDQVVIKFAPGAMIVADGKAAAKGKEAGKRAVPPRRGQPAIKVVIQNRAVPAKRVVFQNPNMNPMIQQYVQQGQPMLYAELLFAARVCKLDRPMLRCIYPEAKTALETVAKKLANGQIRGVGQGNGNGNQSQDAIGELRQEIAHVLQKHLSAEQMRVYTAEARDRIATQRDAASRFIVDAIDRELYLSDDQRRKIQADIRKNWDDHWLIYVDYMLYGNRFFPNEIDKYVTPVLSKTQKTVWLTTQRVSGFWGFGGVWVLPGNDTPLASYFEGEIQDLPRDVFAPAPAAAKKPARQR